MMERGFPQYLVREAQSVFHQMKQKEKNGENKRFVMLYSVLNIDQSFGGICRLAMLVTDFALLSGLENSSTLKTEVTYSFDMSVDFQ
jgi:hypothetical protein